MIAKVELVDDLERARSIAVELEQRMTEAFRIVENFMRESCYDPVSMEYGPGYPCPRCRLRKLLGGAA